MVAGALALGREAYRISGLSGPSSPGFGPLAMVAVVLSGLALELARIVADRPGEREPLAVRLRRLQAEVAPLPVVGAVPFLLLYAYGLEALGFVASSFLFLVAAIGLLLRRRWLLVLLVATATVASIRLLFQEIFQVLLP